MERVQEEIDKVFQDIERIIMEQKSKIKESYKMKC